MYCYYKPINNIKILGVAGMEGNNKFNNFYEDYNKVFAIVHADSKELLEQVYRLRYQVYCVENDWENHKQNSNGLETDEFDCHSAHCLLIHKDSGLALGSVRLVLRSPNIPLDRTFPLQRLCDLDIFHNEQYLSSAGEVSRFCVSKEFRRRATDTLYASVSNQDHNIANDAEIKNLNKRIIPYGPIGLIRAIFEMGIKTDTISAFATMEPSLIRVLNTLGLTFELIGKPIEHRGIRQPLIMHPLQICETVKNKEKAIWEVLTDKGRVEEEMRELTERIMHSPLHNSTNIPAQSSGT